VLSSGVPAAQITTNNLQTLLQLFDRVAIRVVNEMPRDRVTAIRVNSPASIKPEERFLFSRLVTVLNDSLRLPIFKAPVDSLQTATLTYQLHRCEIVYRPLPRKYFWQNARWQRAVQVMVELGIHDTSTRQIVFQKIFEESAVDTLSKKNLPALEDQNLAFTIGKKQQDDGEFHWLEPVLIASATGAVIYLFYSLRSR